MLMSGFIVFMATSNRAASADQDYIVSFVVGQTRLGLVYVNQSDAGIHVGQISITPMDKAIGSTAAITLYGYWDYGFSIEVFTTYAGYAAKPIRLGSLKFDEVLRRISAIRVLPHVPGVYHPLHRFRSDLIQFWWRGRSGYLLTTGSLVPQVQTIMYLTYSMAEHRRRFF